MGETLKPLPLPLSPFLAPNQLEKGELRLPVLPLSHPPIPPFLSQLLSRSIAQRLGLSLLGEGRSLRAQFEALSCVEQRVSAVSSSSPEVSLRNPSFGISSFWWSWAESLPNSFMSFLVRAVFLPWQRFQELRWSRGATISIRARLGLELELELVLEDFVIRGRKLAHMTPPNSCYDPSSSLLFLFKN